MANNRVAMILMDYPDRTRLKILGRAEIVEGPAAAQWIEQLRTPEYKAPIERVFVIRVEAFDWNCQQHITPRFTTAQIKDALTPFEERLRQLEEENARLRDRLTRT